MFNLKTFHRWHWLPFTVLLIGILSTGLLIGIYRINQGQRMNFEFANVLMDLQIKTSTFHLWFEEALTKRNQTEIDKTLVDLDSALSLSDILVFGGESEHGTKMEPLNDPPVGAQAKAIRTVLVEFKRLALLRLQNPKTGGIGSALDDQFNDVFHDFQNKAAALERATEETDVRQHARTKRLLAGIFFAWISVVVAATIGLWNREARRKTAEQALQKTNEQLQVRTEELRKHQEHLAELVEERTAELATTNQSLQQEIKERAEAEQFLQASANRFRTLVENLPLIVSLKDKNSTYLYCNDNCARDLKIRPHEIFGKTDYDFFPREQAERNIALDRRIMQSGRTEQSEERYPRDGQEAVYQKIKVPIKDERGGAGMLLSIVRDVTEKVRLESIAEAVNAMKNVGYAFSGISHEIGNPINSAKMCLSILKKKIDACSKETIETYIDRAMGEISRVQYLLKTLKSFNMYETPELQNVEIKPLMDKFLPLLADDLGKKGIALQTIFDPEAQWGYVDPRALHQVLLNIVSNAADALDGRENPQIIMTGSKGGSTLRITVADNGCGISEDQQIRLFTPFYTTKPSGTGLGLVIAKKLMAKMNGTMEIRSKRGEGTRVEISFQEGRERME